MARIRTVEHRGLKMELPQYIPSISSIKTNYTPLEYLELIKASGVNSFLISAYDIYNQDAQIRYRIIDILNQLEREGKKIVLDSGNYESYWNRDSEWSIEKHNDILKNEFCSFCFSFDEQDIDNKSNDELIKIICDNYFFNQASTKGSIVPIIHAGASQIEEICCEVSNICKPKYIAIPERLLGGGILARVNKLKSIRESLNASGDYVPIHLLGTGNPLAILLYVYAGADMFDGLEWCQTCIDPETYQVYHFQLREVFDNSERIIDNYDMDCLLRNLYAYHRINKQIKSNLDDNRIVDLMNTFFSEDFLKQI